MKGRKIYTRVFLILTSILLVITSQAQFITQWKTTTVNEEIMIPTTGTGYNYNVDWGDATANSTAITGIVTHKYSTPGTYQVTITGTFPRISFNDDAQALKIIEVTQWGNNPWTNMMKAFFGCANLNLTATDAPVLSGVTDMKQMFAKCSSLNPLAAAATAMGSWNTSTITDMTSTFSGASAFNQDISAWNTGSVTLMSSMFNGASTFNQDINGWNTANVTFMSSMFSEASKFNQDLNSWNTGKVKSMSAMFNQATDFNGDISAWNTAIVSNSMASMFNGATHFNRDISGWNTGNVGNMSSMFKDAIAFNQNISGWNTAKVSNMGDMFNGAIAFNQNLGSWNIIKISSMLRMLNNTALSRANYDNTLIGWDSQTGKRSNVKLGAIGLVYCQGENARTNLMSSLKWDITGDELNCSIVPLELISFTAQKSGTDAVQIHWASGVENNIASLSVERRSDASSWKTINTQQPKGNNSRYVAYDNSPDAGKNYYRLLMSDLDGSKSYSDIQSINFSKASVLAVSPNPTTGLLKINHLVIGDDIVLVDITGRQLMKQKASNTEQTLNLHSISAGTYFISIIRDGKFVLKEKILKVQ